MDREILSPAMPDNRIIGYDFARSLALMGMVIISFWELGGEGDNAPEWINIFVEIIMGRAAVAFVILAGIGLSLLTKSAFSYKDAVFITPYHNNLLRNNLLRRALFLFIIGMLNSQVWPWDILHFYAVYFMIGVFFVTAPNRKLWVSILVVIIIFSVFMLMVSFERGEEWDAISPADLWYLSGTIYHLLFCGLYPVFPWIGFIFIGIWLGRRDLRNRDFRKKILIASIAAVIFAEGLSWTFFHKIIPKLSVPVINQISPWFFIDPWEPLPLFFLSGAGTAIIVICLSVIFAEKFRTAKWLSPFVVAGQSTLTLYVAHIPLGISLIGVMDFFELEYPLFPIWGTISFFTVAIIFCYKWNLQFNKGPMELLTRHFLVSPKRFSLSS